MPQWQGGDNPNYPLGTELLAFLAPDTGQETLRVHVDAPGETSPKLEGGIVHRQALLTQLRQARQLLDDAQPDRIVTFGGDCLVEQAPMSYLNEKYDGKLGVLWVDAHPDIKVPSEWMNAHTMVLGNLLGEGDEEFAAQVGRKVEPHRVMYGGLREVGLTEQETGVIERLGLRVASPESLAVDSSAILRWLEEEQIEHLAIHLDLDVLDPTSFRSVLFAEPEPEIDWMAKYPVGKMTLPQVVRVMTDVAAATDVVGLGVCEHLPWDMVHLKQALAAFPLVS